MDRRAFIVGAGAALVAGPALAREAISDGVALFNTAHPISFEWEFVDIDTDFGTLSLIRSLNQMYRVWSVNVLNDNALETIEIDTDNFSKTGLKILK